MIIFRRLVGVQCSFALAWAGAASTLVAIQLASGAGLSADAVPGSALHAVRASPCGKDSGQLGNLGSTQTRHGREP